MRVGLMALVAIVALTSRIALAAMPVPDGAAPVRLADQGTPPSAGTDKPPPPPPSTAKIDASGILGQTVEGEGGKEIGRIVNVLVDQTGAPRAAVIDFGGFMGVGDRKIAVDWSSLKFTAPGAHAAITLTLTEEQIAHAPDYKEASQAPAVVVGPPSPVPTPGP